MCWILWLKKYVHPKIVQAPPPPCPLGADYVFNSHFFQLFRCFFRAASFQTFLFLDSCPGHDWPIMTFFSLSFFFFLSQLQIRAWPHPPCLPPTACSCKPTGLDFLLICKVTSLPLPITLARPDPLRILCSNLAPAGPVSMPLTVCVIRESPPLVHRTSKSVVDYNSPDNTVLWKW